MYTNNNKQNTWNLIFINDQELNLPEENREVFIVVEEDSLDMTNNTIENLPYYPETYKAILCQGKHGFFWSLIGEPQDCEQILLQHQTVVAWRYT